MLFIPDSSQRILNYVSTENKMDGFNNVHGDINYVHWLDLYRIFDWNGLVHHFWFWDPILSPIQVNITNAVNHAWSQNTNDQIYVDLVLLAKSALIRE